MSESKALEKVTYSGIEFDVDRDSQQAWVHDLKLAEILGYARLAEIRYLIKRLIRDGFLNDSNVLRTVRKTSEKGGRPGIEYHLSHLGAIIVCLKSETDNARKATLTIAQTFEAVVKGEFVHKSLLKAEDRYKQLETEYRIVETKLLEQIDSYKNLATLSDGGANESRVCDPGNELLQDTLKTQFKHLGQYVAMSTNRVIECIKKNDEKTKVGSIYTITVSKGRLLSKTISLVMQGVLPPSYLGVNASPVRPPEPVELPIFQWAKEQGLIDPDWSSWQH